MASRTIVALLLCGLLGCACPGGTTPKPKPPPDVAWLTIRLPAYATCDGGRFTVDGLMKGEYPVARFVIRPGEHVIGLRSDGDCAGMGDHRLAFKAGEELVLNE